MSALIATPAVPKDGISQSKLRGSKGDGDNNGGASKLRVELWCVRGDSRSKPPLTTGKHPDACQRTDRYQKCQEFAHNVYQMSDARCQMLVIERPHLELYALLMLSVCY